MAGVYIPGMEMPNGGTVKIEIGYDADGHPMALTEDYCVYDAIPVPDHGRLVDADKLGIRDAEKQAYEAYLRAKGEDFIEEPLIEYHRGYLEGLTHASGMVRFASTVIPADREEKGDGEPQIQVSRLIKIATTDKEGKA